jgi:glutamyl-Q tRNA(Asp) synthetase
MFMSRFAPSPTGKLHLGHAFSAVLGHLRAVESGGAFLVRIEDLDQTRSRPGFVEGIFEDLRWLGLDWSEPVLVQSERASIYDEALRQLRELGLVYPCFCTRSDIAAALEAPHGAAARYPGTCRHLADDPKRREAMPHSWRLDSQKALEVTGLPSWAEIDGREFAARRDDIDDIILARKDAPFAYHLAVVIDDARSGQRVLQELLGLPRPTYLHHPLVAHSDGRRLAKRDLAPTLSAMRNSGVSGPKLAADLRAGKLPLGFTFVDA